jgi:OmpA-OmpF porin, OOP family
MKSTVHLTGMALLAVGLALPAAAADKGWYFLAEGGVAIGQDVNAEVGGASGEAEVDVGTRFDLGVGYSLNKNWALEFDTGWVWNRFTDTDGSISHIPLMINGVFRYPMAGGKWVPYIGAGLGGTYSMLDVDDGTLDDSDGDFNFAWQGMAGIKYMIKENMSLGLGYKYLATLESNFEIEGVDVSLENSHNHAFGLVFNMSF